MSENYLFAEEVEEDYDVFDKALKKKHFEGKKGHLLMELQATFKNDNRFVMDKKFKNDIDVKKVSTNVKKLTKVFDSEQPKNSIDKDKQISTQEDIEKEKNKNLSILSQVISNTEFLGTVQPKKYSNPKNFLIKRFDPKLNLGQELIVKKEVKSANLNDKNIIKLQKGVSNEKEENLLPADKLKNYKKQKEKLIQKEMNELQMAIEPKIEINYSSWKNIVEKGKEENKNLIFSPFDGYVESELKTNNFQNKNPTINNKSKENKKSFNLFEDCKESDKNSIKKIQDHKEKKINPEEEEILLKKKRKKEQRKISEKQKKEEIKLQEKQKDEEIEKVLKEELLKVHDEEKVNNYMRYVNLIREKKDKKGKPTNK
jgi:hypothetical protein